MNRIEMNVQTGESRVIELTPDEVADAEARTAALTPTATEVAISEIVAIEQSHPITHRSLRELILALGSVYPAAQSTVFYQKAVEVEVLIDPLRAQLRKPA